MHGMKQTFLTAFLIVMIMVPLQAAKTDHLVNIYKKGEYKQVCRDGMQSYYRGNKEPHFAAMVGIACAKSDAINPLGSLQRSLVTSPALRSSATYFSTLLLAKRLLYQHFIDGIDLEHYALPKYNHVLSIVFDHVARNDFTRMGKSMIRIEAGKLRILVSVSDDKPARLLMDEYRGAKLVQRHWYQ